MLFLLELAVGVFLTGITAWLIYTVTPENISRCEKICRNRIAGLLIALPCTLACVPLAIPVSPGFLLNLLYPAAVILPVLCYFYIDYYAARSLAFFLILLAYDIIHGAFELHTPGAAVVTVMALLTGVAGIWISAKPCSLRDVFRKSAGNKMCKYSCFAAAAVMFLLSLYMLIMVVSGVSVQ